MAMCILALFGAMVAVAAGAPVANDPALLGRNDARPINILVKLDYEPVASYAGGVPGLVATTPQLTGKKLRDNKDAVEAYTRYVTAREIAILEYVHRRIPEATVRQSLRVAYGGVAMSLP